MPPVTLVIAVKNEVINLSAHLLFWVDQDYPKLEIILVDDHSEDGSVRIIEDYAENNENIRLYTNRGSGKKAALTTGISAASGTWIITTDADCKPASDQWIYDIMIERNDADVILLYGPYHQVSGFLNKFIRYETWYIAMQYLSLANVGLPYMGVGRNLAYKKDVFINQGGFSQHEHIKSGDDDLFIAGLSPETNIDLNLKSYTYSTPATSLSNLIQQKRRHLTTATSYPIKHQLILMTLFLSQLLFYTGLVGLFLGSTYIQIAIGLFIIRSIVLLWVAFNKMTLLKESKLWYWAPVLDILLLIYYCIMGLMMSMKKKTW